MDLFEKYYNRLEEEALSETDVLDEAHNDDEDYLRLLAKYGIKDPEIMNKYRSNDIERKKKLGQHMTDNDNYQMIRELQQNAKKANSEIAEVKNDIQDTGEAINNQKAVMQKMQDEIEEIQDFLTEPNK